MSGTFSVNGATWLAQLTDADVEAHVGRLAFERALGYVDAERVRSINTGDRGRLLLATVDGGREHPYTAIATVLESGPPTRFNSKCSCPVGSACKHVGALLLVARDAAGGLNADQPDQWRQIVQAALKEAEPRAETTPLAVRFHQFHQSYVRDKPFPLYSLDVVRMGRSGQFLQQSMLTHLHDPYGEFDRQQTSALRDFADHNEGPVALNTLSPQQLSGLMRAVRAGVELLPGVRQRGKFTVHPQPVRPSAEFERLPDGAVQARLVDLPQVPGERQYIGDPAYGAVIWDGEATTVVAFDQPLAPALQALCRHGEFRIPAHDADEFFDLYFPRFAQFTAHAAAVTEPIRLHLRVRPEDLRLHVELSWLYAGAHHRAVSLDYADRSRDRRVELSIVQAVTELLQPHGLLEQVGGLGWWPITNRSFEGFAAVAFVEQLRRLSDHEHVVVDVEGDVPGFEESAGAPLIEIGTGDVGDPDWFDLHVTVSVDDEEVPFEQLFAALARGDDALLLASGTWFTLEQPSLQRLRHLIEEARDLTDRGRDGLQINKFQIGLWDELVALGVTTEQSAAWQQTVERLTDLEHLGSLETPGSLDAQLRPYQAEGYQWLTTLWDAGLGGVLADDMGLGKTVQTIAMLARAAEAGDLDAPVLVVAPSSVVGTWVRELQRFAPGIPVRAVRQTSRKRGRSIAEAISDAQVVVTSYAVLRLDADEFAATSWRALVLDEAQSVKNYQSKTFHAAKRIGAPFSLAITGTPLENSLMDLWAMFALVAPGLYPRPEVFAQRYRKPIELEGSADTLDELRRRIRPLMLRRTKDQVATDLPDKQIQVVSVPMSPRHEQTYNRHLQRERQRILGLLDDPDANRIAILASLTKLRQLALDPRLVVEDYPANEQSSKLQFLTEQLRELGHEGHRALVFSQFTSCLRLAEEALTAGGVTTAYLDGSTRDRDAVIDGFKDGDQTAFLISLKAGGVGLTLTEADYVFILDPWWNPATEAQAIDRAHRIGQDKPVTVYRLVSESTIEEKVVALQERKRDLFARVVDEGGALGAAMTTADLRGLLS